MCIYPKRYNKTNMSHYFSIKTKTEEHCLEPRIGGDFDYAIYDLKQDLKGEKQVIKKAEAVAFYKETETKLKKKFKKIDGGKKDQKEEEFNKLFGVSDTFPKEEGIPSPVKTDGDDIEKVIAGMKDILGDKMKTQKIDGGVLGAISLKGSELKSVLEQLKSIGVDLLGDKEDGHKKVQVEGMPEYDGSQTTKEQTEQWIKGQNFEELFQKLKDGKGAFQYTYLEYDGDDFPSTTGIFCNPSSLKKDESIGERLNALCSAFGSNAVRSVLESIPQFISMFGHRLAYLTHGKPSTKSFDPLSGLPKLLGGKKVVLKQVEIVEEMTKEVIAEYKKSLD